MALTRRDFGKLTLAAVPAGVLLTRGIAGAASQAARPMSKWAGVQVGLNVPYSLGTGNNIAAEDLLQRIVAVGYSGVELRAQPIEHYLGSPSVRAAAGRGRGNQPRSPADREREAAETRKWRLSAPTSRIAEVRRLYEDAGVLIEILKVDGLYELSPDELDYFFQMARDLGARAISAELPEDLDVTKRIGAFADRHRIWAAYHHHAQAGPAEYERVFELARYNGANIDIGHFTAAQNTSPLPFITKHAARIPHIHVKDRKLGTNGGQNMPFGQGDTPVREILQAIRDHAWTMQATVEFEYPVPEGSDRTAEILRCRDFCRDALLA